MVDRFYVFLTSAPLEDVVVEDIVIQNCQVVDSQKHTLLALAVYDVVKEVAARLTYTTCMKKHA